VESTQVARKLSLESVEHKRAIEASEVIVLVVLAVFLFRSFTSVVIHNTIMHLTVRECLRCRVSSPFKKAQMNWKFDRDNWPR